MREQNSFIKILGDLIRDARELKSTQYVGRDSLLTYRTASSADYDLTTTLTLGQTKRYRLQLDYDKATNGAIEELNLYYRLDNSDVMGDPVLRTPPTNPHVAVYWYRETLEETYTTWIVIVSNISVTLTPVPYVKYFIDGTSGGSVSITAI